MGDYYQTLVVLDVPGAIPVSPIPAEELVKFLLAEGLMQKHPSSHWGGGYAVGPRAAAYVTDAPKGYHWQDSGAVEMSRDSRFHGDINVPADATCPKCRGVANNLEWYEPPLLAVLERIEDEAVVPLACPQCGQVADVREWSFDPPVAFGTPAVNFVNWPPLAPHLMTELSERIGRPVGYVRWDV
jgi:hypothetical protein